MGGWAGVVDVVQYARSKLHNKSLMLTEDRKKIVRGTLPSPYATGQYRQLQLFPVCGHQMQAGGDKCSFICS